MKESKLTDDEFKNMKQHVSIGQRVLQKAIDDFKIAEPFFIMGRNICAYHHEKYNGKGYLEGLEGKSIPLEARIFALCDVYDALRSKRPYKEAFSHHQSMEIIKSEQGKHFDPDVVAAFLACEGEFLRLSENRES